MNTFVNFLHAALLAGTPLMFGTLGEIVTEKAGNLNLGVAPSQGFMWALPHKTLCSLCLAHFSQASSPPSSMRF